MIFIAGAAWLHAHFSCHGGHCVHAHLVVPLSYVVPAQQSMVIGQLLLSLFSWCSYPGEAETPQIPMPCYEGVEIWWDVQGLARWLQLQWWVLQGSAR